MYQDFLVSSKLLVRIAKGAWQPPTDVFETEDGVFVRMEVAIVDPSQVELTIEANRIAIRGRRDEPPCGKCRAFRQMEIHYGAFEREIWVEGPWMPLAPGPLRWHRCARDSRARVSILENLVRATWDP